MKYIVMPIEELPTENDSYFILESHLGYDVKSVAMFNSGRWLNLPPTTTHWLKPSN